MNQRTFVDVPLEFCSHNNNEFNFTFILSIITINPITSNIRYVITLEL